MHVENQQLLSAYHAFLSQHTKNGIASPNRANIVRRKDDAPQSQRLTMPGFEGFRTRWFPYKR